MGVAAANRKARRAQQAPRRAAEEPKGENVARAFTVTSATGVRPDLDTLAGMGRLRKLGGGVM